VALETELQYDLPTLELGLYNFSFKEEENTVKKQTEFTLWSFVSWHRAVW
jgi:hypothetical protein